MAGEILLKRQIEMSQQDSQPAKTALIYAHWDVNGLVDPYVVHAMRSYREVADRLIFVSTHYRHKNRELESLVDNLIVRPNIGFDFSSWRDGLRVLVQRNYGQVIFANSSVFGPLWSPREALFNQESRNADLWGMSISVEATVHLQSYLMVMSNRLLESTFGSHLWSEVYDLATQRDVIEAYELRWMGECEREGFRVGAMFDQRRQPRTSHSEMFAELAARPISLKRIRRHLRMWRKGAINPTHAQWLTLCKAGVPFVKVDLMRDNPCRMSLERVYSWLSENTTYPVELIKTAIARMRRQGLSKQTR